MKGRAIDLSKGAAIALGMRTGHRSSQIGGHGVREGYLLAQSSNAAKGLAAVMLPFAAAGAFIALCLAFWVATAAAAANGVAVWGADLSPSEKTKIVQLMGIEPSDMARELTVTNAEEHALLGSTVPASYLGTRAVSSAYVRPLEAGKGLKITTHNITWVSKRMFAQALVTAGMRDAEVIAAAPVPVSGTAALTGIFKAFETASGDELPRRAKELAGEELYITRGRESIGQEQAGRLMEMVKRQVVEQGLTDEEQVIEVVRRIAADLDLSLTEREIERIASLMSKLQELDLKLDDLDRQLRQISDNVSILAEGQRGLRSSLAAWLQQLLDFLARLLEQLMSFAGGVLKRLLPARGYRLSGWNAQSRVRPYLPPVDLPNVKECGADGAYHQPGNASGVFSRGYPLHLDKHGDAWRMAAVPWEMNVYQIPAG